MKRILCVEKISDEAIDGIWPICTEIAQNMAYPSFFCCGDWLKLVAEFLSLKDQQCFLVVKARDSIKGILPLVKNANPLGGKDLRFLGAEFHPDPVGLIAAAVDRAECAIALRKYLISMPGWDRLFLDWVLEDEAVDWGLSGKAVSIEPFKSLPQNFDLLLNEFKRKKRYNLQAMVRKSINAGIELVKSNDTCTHQVFLESLFLMHKKRAAEKKLKSSFQGPRVEKLHRRLVEESEKVRLYGLRLKNQIISVIYGFEFCNRFFYYQVAHDPDYKNFSPGSVLLFLVIEDCCSRGINEFNFLQGDESYKEVWTNESRVLCRLVLGSGRWRARGLDGFEKVKNGFKIAMRGIGCGR